MKLGTMLLRDAVISLNQLEAGLRAQVIYGGRLGTNLVELNFLDVNTLGVYLARILDIPLATKELFEAAETAVIRSFDAELAELYTAFPLGFEPDHPDMLAVALAEPRDDVAIGQLATQCGHEINPYVAPELRIYYYHEKHYGLSRKARFVRTGSARTLPQSNDERRKTQAPHGMQIPPTVRFEPKKKKTPEPAEEEAKQSQPRISLEKAIAAIEAADHRNQIGETIVDYAVGRFEVAIVFILRDANALGWRVYSAAGGSGGAVEKLGLPLGGTSVLQAAFDSGAAYRGPSPSAGRPVEKELWDAVGRKTVSEDMLVLPVSIKKRVVNLVYVHGFGDHPIESSYADEIGLIAERAGEAYLRLITAAKNAARNEQTE